MKKAITLGGIIFLLVSSMTGKNRYKADLVVI